MKITNQQLLMSVPTINKLMVAKLNDAVASYRIMKNARVLSDELNAYNTWLKTQDEVDESILEEEIEVNIRKINLSSLNGADLSPLDMSNILFMLEEEDEPHGEPDGKMGEQPVQDIPPANPEGVQNA